MEVGDVGPWFRSAQPWIGTLAQWVGAFGTISAVIVALSKEEMLRWFRRPKLVAVLKAEYPYASRLQRATVRPQTCGEALATGFGFWSRMWDGRGQIRSKCFSLGSHMSKQMNQCADSYR